MLKLTVAVLAIALAGAASAADSPSLRVDASSNAAFKRSLVAFKDELSPEQRQAFGEALKDVWIAGTQAAESERVKYRAADYYRQIHGLSYEEVVNLTTGESAKLRLQVAAAPPNAAASPHRAAAASRKTAPYRGAGGAYGRSPWEGVPPPPSTWQPRGGTDLFGPGPAPR